MNSSSSLCARFSHRALDQLGAVVDRHDLDAARQPGAQRRQLGLDRGDRVERVLARTHHDDAAGGFAFAVELADAAAHVRAELDARDIAELAPTRRRRRSSAAPGGSRRASAGNPTRAPCTRPRRARAPSRRLPGWRCGSPPPRSEARCRRRPACRGRAPPGTGAPCRRPKRPRRRPARSSARTSGTSPAAHAAATTSCVPLRSTSAYW